MLAVVHRSARPFSRQPQYLRTLQVQVQPRNYTMGDSKGDSKGSVLDWVKPGDNSGEFKRQTSQFRDAISRKEGAKFPPEKDRYHLYVSYACPWAHRAMIVRKLKGLEEILPITTVHWHLGEKGWRFIKKDEDLPGEGATPDPLHADYTHLRDLYFKADPDYNARFTVPTLWDKKNNTIVSNESADILRFLYTEFDDIIEEKYRTPQVDLLPKDLESKIDESNDWTYNDINNGVYKSGFATTQEAYEKNVTTLFKSLDRAEKHLADTASEGPYYYGKTITEADVRLYTTIVRFDVVYVQHFKCNIKDIRSGYPHLHKWVRNLYWNHSAFKDTTSFDHIKKHYTRSHAQINPPGITPVGPLPNILSPDEEVAAAAKTS